MNEEYGDTCGAIGIVTPSVPKVVDKVGRESLGRGRGRERERERERVGRRW